MLLVKRKYRRIPFNSVTFLRNVILNFFIKNTILFRIQILLIMQQAHSIAFSIKFFISQLYESLL